MNKITVNKSVIEYVIGLAIVKGIALGKRGEVDIDVEDVIQSLSKQFTNDIERYSKAKPRY